MKKYKRTIIVVVSILLLILIGIKLEMFEFLYSKYNNYKYSKINYDIKITYKETLHEFVGFASSIQFVQIDIKNKTAYLVENYFIYGNVPEYNRGDHYKIKNKINLSDSEVQQLIEIANRESNYEEELKKISENLEKENNQEGTGHISQIWNIDYYLIEYGDKEIKLVCSSAPEITRLFKK